MSGDQLISTQSILNQPSPTCPPQSGKCTRTHSACILEYGCAIGTMVSKFIDAGVCAIIMIVPLLLLMCRRLPHCQASIIALVACRKAGIVALIMMALLQSMRRRFCYCPDGNCCSCHNPCQCAGVSAVVKLALLLLLLVVNLALLPSL